VSTEPLRFSFAEAGDIDADRRPAIVGGKGAALARMTAMGLPVPPGFTLTTGACREVLANGWFDQLDAELIAGVRELEDAIGRRLGDPSAPLLVSVRSGAPISMPGMMDTVLNAGITEAVADALGRAAGDERFGWDTYRRFVQSYVGVVLGADREMLRAALEHAVGSDEGAALGGADLARAVVAFRDDLVAAGYEIPADPENQIRSAAQAVFASWGSDRARVYREVEGISADLGTAATVQAMTFGNLGSRSGTGVAFSRDPSTGAPGLVGDFLVGAQGEDVVAGTHATQPISQLRAEWPEIADELDAAADMLERDLADLADIEFTVEDGTFWLLQVRRGKRSARAALRIAIDMADEADFPLDRAEAVARVVDLLDHPPTEPNPDAVPESADDVLATGLAASPGRAVGVVCTTIDEAVAAGAAGSDIVLFRRETSPADIAGMAAARALVTTLGGIVSHAAVVARGWGVPAVVGVAGVQVEGDGIRVDGIAIPSGTIVTVDGDTGRILRGAHAADRRELDEVRVLRAWRDEIDAHSHTEVASKPGEAASPEACERVLALKGMGSAEAVADVLGCPTEDVEAVIAGLVAAADAQELPAGRVRLLPAAIARVDERFAADAVRIGPTIEPLLDDFHTVNDRFKEVVTAWQMKERGGDMVPNEHDDPAYDEAVIARLRTEIHAAIEPIIAAVVDAEPRFERYVDRLAVALDAVEGGDAQMVAHPLRDSYHTVWFELHEELIRLSGRNRADEAAAGRA
jgi:pyruvate,orthophosphate dikinase